MSRRFTLIILVAMVLGIAVGYAIHAAVGETGAEAQARLASISGNFSLITDVFLRLVKMIIAPLVLSTLVVGIAHTGHGAVGRIGAKTLGWFIAASILSLLLGVLMVSLLQPGVGLDLPLPPTDAAVAVERGALNLKDFVTHLFPRSIVEAMATNEILQIVVFSAFFGVALAALGDKAALLVELFEQVVAAMLKVTGYVMLFAPLAVFAAIAATVVKHGLDILLTYAKFILGFYAALLCLWLVLAGAGALFVGRRILTLMGMLREPILLAFSTASSEAAYPRTLEQLERFGVPRRIAGFVLPLGYSFNLDGSMMYCTFATLFIAQAYGVELTGMQIATMLGLLMVTSKGMAGVPRASLVVIAATLVTFGLPETGLLLILAVDHFLDMGRSATNVIGNSVATVVVARWEGALGRHEIGDEPVAPGGAG